VTQPLDRLVVVGHDRLSRQVPGGHHEDVRAGLVLQPEQQRVQGGVGQHHPEVGVPGCDHVGDAVAVGARQQHDRLAGPVEEPALLGGAADQPVRHLGVAGHHRERLGSAPLAPP
jgi:hypothetical protein